MQDSFVSVVIPTFNRGAQLRTAVTSVLAQTHKNMELIVVDDCSKVAVAASLADITDERLRIVRHLNNRGVSGARNTGAHLAKGDLLAFLDDDDRWLPTKLERQLACSDWTKCSATLTDFSTAGRQTLYERKNSRRDPEWLIATGAALAMGSSILVKRDTFNDVGDFNTSLRRAQDWDWMLRFHKAGHKVGIVPEPLVIYGGAHRSRPEIEAMGVNVIRSLHGGDFSGSDKFSRAFQAAMMWKAARVEVEQNKVWSAVAKLACVAARYPTHSVRYARSLLSSPVRGFLDGVSRSLAHRSEPATGA